ncbi:hypothetical protein RCL1_003627 [Eukaryota sp. TZLM3-RCL]
MQSINSCLLALLGVPSSSFVVSDSNEFHCALSSTSSLDLSLFDKVLLLGNQRLSVSKKLQSRPSSFILRTIFLTISEHLFKIDQHYSSKFEFNEFETLSHLFSIIPELTSLYSFLLDFFSVISQYSQLSLQEQITEILVFLYKASRDQSDSPFTISFDCFAAGIQAYWEILSQYVCCTYVSVARLSETFLIVPDDDVDGSIFWVKTKLNQSIVSKLNFISEFSADSILFSGKVTYLFRNSSKLSINISKFQDELQDIWRLPTFDYVSLSSTIARYFTSSAQKSRDATSAALWKILITPHPSSSTSCLSFNFKYSGILQYLDDLSLICLHLNGTFSSDLINHFSPIFRGNCPEKPSQMISRLWTSFMSLGDYSHYYFPQLEYILENNLENLNFSPKSLAVWQNLTLNIPKPSPFALIMTDDLIQVFKFHFNFILFFKYCYFELLSSLRAGFPRNYLSAPRLLVVLRYLISFQLQSILNILLLNLNFQHNILIQSLSKVSSFDDAVKSVSKFVQSIKNFGLMTSSPLCQFLMNIGDVALELAQKCRSESSVNNHDLMTLYSTLSSIKTAVLMSLQKSSESSGIVFELLKVFEQSELKILSENFDM